MVSSTVTNHEEDVLESVKTTPPQGIASGDYLLVGWDMDATGKRLLDEICQIAAYTPTSTYSQYVMPFKNLNPPAKKRHRIKVVTMGRYRVLKNSITNKVTRIDTILKKFLFSVQPLTNICHFVFRWSQRKAKFLH